MTEQEANQLKAVLGGEVLQTGGGVYVLILKEVNRPYCDDARVLVFSGEVIAEYFSREFFDDGMQPAAEYDLDTVVNYDQS